ncbi:VOC family protein [Bradyrhizobium sp. BWA-3-5]|uniref:VOC family protein n=1 Tax=Bradyrhizobium sp. BWA-3-5 TaxID=3080013 RepID=UPI00293EDE16|nr:VOC family protein [Bradyrhizobium sp. BWA-3-5]WOH65360.1 VOC family protein [Bradyrhizobium sp. BWA-3-5]
MAHRGLTGAVLYAKDLHRLVQFYTAVAGLDVQKIERAYAVLGREPSQLVIVRIPKRIAAAIQITTPPKRREDTPIKLVFAAEDIAIARSRAAELGGTMNAVNENGILKALKSAMAAIPRAMFSRSGRRAEFLNGPRSGLAKVCFGSAGDLANPSGASPLHLTPDICALVTQVSNGPQAAIPPLISSGPVLL